MNHIFTLTFLLISCKCFGAPANDLNNSVIQSAGTVFRSAKELGANLLVPPVKAREEAQLETEDLNSAIVSVYDNAQAKASNALNTPSLIDSIQEHEKYGNQGGSNDGVARMIINGYEAFSNFMNQVLNKPGDLIRNVSKSLNVHLDNIGGRIVGLN